MNLLGLSKNGIKVVDRYNSHLDKRIRDLVVSGLTSVDLTLDIFQEHTIYFEKEIGYSNVVGIDIDDSVFYARRLGRKGLSKFVNKKPSIKTKSLTIVLLKSNDNEKEYILITAYIGERVGPEPFDKNCKEEDKKQWRNLAFMSNLVDYDIKTVTDVPPEYWKY